MGAPDHQSLGQRSILMVDDDDALCRAAARNLRLDGYHVEYDHDSEVALARLVTTRFDLVLVDLEMSKGNDGLWLIREISKRYREVRTIVFSAHYEDDLIQDATRLGAWDYWRKPIDDLARRVGRSLAEPLMPPKVNRRYDPRAGDAAKLLARLTQTELAIATDSANGIPIEEIAKSRGSAEGTVKRHREHILEKTDARNFLDPVFHTLRLRSGR